MHKRNYHDLAMLIVRAALADKDGSRRMRMVRQRYCHGTDPDAFDLLEELYEARAQEQIIRTRVAQKRIYGKFAWETGD